VISTRTFELLESAELLKLFEGDPVYSQTRLQLRHLNHTRGRDHWL